MFPFMKFFNSAATVEQAALKTIESEAAKVAALASSAAKMAEAAPMEAVELTESEFKAWMKKPLAAAEIHNAAMSQNMSAPGAPRTITSNAIVAKPKPARPGDTPPRAFVGNTLEQLTKARDNYTTERDLLAKDIAKLTDEHGQLETSLEVLQAAIDKLAPPVAPAPMPPVAPWTQADIDAAAPKAVATELGGNVS